MSLFLEQVCSHYLAKKKKKKKKKKRKEKENQYYKSPKCCKMHENGHGKKLKERKKKSQLISMYVSKWNFRAQGLMGWEFDGNNHKWLYL